MTAKDTIAAYATWTQPGRQFAVGYSLAMFHEIDFLVNEAYRRIPHGGIEIGGVLFGAFEESSVRLDAFRIIECEHASGPSFTLSDRDLTLLKQQLANAASDPELESLQPVGWFIAHTRSELRMNERELALFDELFPEPGRMTLLIKPERFQPTRFGFLVRDSDGRMNTDATCDNVILPLLGRSTQMPGSEAGASSPGERPKPREALFKEGERRVDKLPVTPAEVLPQTVPVLLESEAMAGSRIQTPEPVQEQHSSRFSRALSREPRSPEVTPGSSSPAEKRVSERASEALVKATALPPLEDIRKVRPLELQRRALDPNDRQYQIRPAGRAWAVNLRLVAIFLLVAVLGCAVGYWTYQRILPPPIPLTVEPKTSTLLVSWPAYETREAGFAALRIDDGNPMPLTPEQKAAGEAEISLSAADVKVELIVQHWIGDARGIVRYVRAPQLPAVSGR